MAGLQAYEILLAVLQAYEILLAVLQAYERQLAVLQAYELQLAVLQAYDILLAVLQAYDILLAVLQAYENAGDLERQSEQVVPLQSKLELAVNERDAALAKVEGLTPRPGLRAFDGLTPEGCKKLGAAFDAHRYGRART